MQKQNVKEIGKTVGTAAVGTVVGILTYNLIKLAGTKVSGFFAKKPEQTATTEAATETATEVKSA